MSIEVKSIICPQCGSSDVKLSSDGKNGTCNSCGSSFVIQEENPFQDLFQALLNRKRGEEKGELSKIILKDTISKEEFLRKAWISFADEDAPFDVFEGNFGEIRQTERQVYCETARADLSYTATIGVDRQEEYTDYEDYWEEIPFVNEKGEREVRKEKRQRMVTKTRTVTDWTPGVSNTFSFTSATAVSNIPGDGVDVELFKKCLPSKLENAVIFPTEEEAAKMQVSGDVMDDVKDNHKRNVERTLDNILPGDHQKDVTYRFELSDRSGIVFSAKEYEASISYGGSEYKKHAFCFGSLNVAGDKIHNEKSLESEKKKRRENADNLFWEKTKVLQFINLGLLALSIIFSLFVPVVVLDVIVFAIAAAYFIIVNRKVNKQRDEIDKAASNEIAAFEKEYLKKQRALLNGKLSSLGLNPIQDN